MSHLINETLYEERLECFMESIAIEEINMKNVMAAMNAGGHTLFPQLHDALWNFDSELYCQSIDCALEAYILYKKSMKQLQGMTHEINN